MGRKLPQADGPVTPTFSSSRGVASWRAQDAGEGGSQTPGTIASPSEKFHLREMSGGMSPLALVVGALLAAMVALFAHVIGYDRDRSFYAVVLTVVGSLYPLFAVMAGAQGLIPEVAFFAVFAAMAAVGFLKSLWVVVAGLFLHGVFDFVRHAYLAAPGAPEWWPAFCGAYDVVAAVGLATLLLVQRRAAKHLVRP